MEASNVISGLAAALAAAALAHSFWLERRLQKDDRIIFGALRRPSLTHYEHAAPLLAVNLANLGRRKAAVTAVHVRTEQGIPIDVTWSNAIDHVGNPQDPNGLFLVDEHEVTLFIRADTAPSLPAGATIHISHTHTKTPEALVFNGVEGWNKFLE